MELHHSPLKTLAKSIPLFIDAALAVPKKIFESVPDAIVITNQAGRIVRVNTEEGKLFGYDPDELIGQMVEVLVPERLRAKHVAHWEPLPPPL